MNTPHADEIDPADLQALIPLDIVRKTRVCMRCGHTLDKHSSKGPCQASLDGGGGVCECLLFQLR